MVVLVVGGSIPEQSVEIDGRQVVLLAASVGEDTEESSCQEGGCQLLGQVKTTEELFLPLSPNQRVGVVAGSWNGCTTRLKDEGRRIGMKKEWGTGSRY